MAYDLETVERQMPLTDIRALVDAVHRDISRLLAAPDHEDASTALLESWAALVKWLALGPAPESGHCSSCGRALRRDTITCVYCGMYSAR